MAILKNTLRFRLSNQSASQLRDIKQLNGYKTNSETLRSVIGLVHEALSTAPRKVNLSSNQKDFVDRSGAYHFKGISHK